MGFLSFGEGSFLWSLVTDMVAGTLFDLRAISSKSRRRPKATIFSHNLTTPYNERHN